MVAAVFARTTQVPTLVGLIVPALASSNVHSPLTRLYVSAPSELVVAWTVKSAPGYWGTGAVPKVMVGVASMIVMRCVSVLPVWVASPAKLAFAVQPFELVTLVQSPL